MTSRKLKPPKNFRRVYWPRVCAFCKYIQADGGGWWCGRANDGEFGGDMNDGEQYHSTCDRWQRQDKR